MTGATDRRCHPDWYLPTDLPAEFAAFDAAVGDGLDVGAAGKVGLLDLALAPHDGVTRIERRYQRAPLYVYRPIYLDPCLRGMAFLFVQQSGDGLVQGDRYRMDVHCAPGAQVHVTTQAATKVYRARDNYVTQLVNLSAAAGSVLEYLPDPVVPFGGSRLFSRTSVTVDPSATVMLADVLLPGRIAHGERHAYDVVWAETEFRRPDGRLLCTDVLRLHPAAGEDPTSVGLLGARDVVATHYVITGTASPAALVTLLRATLDDCAGVLAGVTELPSGCGVVTRVLGTSSQRVQCAVRAAWNAARRELLGAPAPDLRKG